MSVGIRGKLRRNLLKKPGKASETSTTHNSSHNVLNMACQQVMNKIQFVLTNVEKRVIN